MHKRLTNVQSAARFRAPALETGNIGYRKADAPREERALKLSADIWDSDINTCLLLQCKSCRARSRAWAVAEQARCALPTHLPGASQQPQVHHHIISVDVSRSNTDKHALILLVKFNGNVIPVPRASFSRLADASYRRCGVIRHFYSIFMQY